ncbi:MAG: hypothetical protein NVSMB5_10300 [Candidatus Velthaea sp.]
MNMTVTDETIDLIALGTGIRAPYERDSSVDACFTACAGHSPDAVAVRAQGVAITYAEIERRSNALARYLSSLGVVRGASVGIAIERSAALPVALLAVLKSGAAYVPLDRANTRERNEFIVADAAISLVLTAGAATENLPVGTVRTVDLVSEAEAVATCDTGPHHATASADSLAYIMYTSGSTGRPKGVAIEHRAILRLVRNTDFVSIMPDDVVLQFAPPAFDASTFEIWAPLLNGATLAIAPAGPLALSQVADAIERLGVTMLWLTAPLFRMMVETELQRFTGLRTLLTGGDTVSAEHAKRFILAAPSCRLIDGYGPTENTTFSCCFTVASPDAIETSVPIGRPIANSTAYVLDTMLRPVPIGVSGELFVGGDGLAREYVNLPELTAERFIRDPFSGDSSARLYRTGDMARWRSDGAIEFLGRIDHQVKIRGFRIELEEIEAALHAHPAVLHAVAVVAERTGEKTLHAFIVPVRGARVSEADLRSHLNRSVPAYMVPHRFLMRESLPQFTSGKIDRGALAREADSARAKTSAPVLGRRAGGGPLMQKVEETWRIVLSAEDVGSDTNFFDAGGDSLLLLALHKRLCDTFSLTLAVTDLFKESTIRKQAALIERAQQ